MYKKAQTSFLFAQPSFGSGMARVLDLWGVFDEYNTSESGDKADERAIASDWAIVGQDLSDVMEESNLEEQGVA